MALERTFKLTFLGDAKKALGELDKIGSGMDGMGRKAKVAAASVTAGVVGIVGQSIKSAADFESQFAEVATLLPDLDTSALEDLRDTVFDIQREFGIAADQAVPAFYQAISASIPPDNVAEFMQVAAQSAAAGVVDLETSVSGITSVINAYGQENISAAEASDILFTAVKLGTTDLEQLSGSLFNVLPQAAALQIPFEEVAAALATITLQGTTTSVATTQLRSLFVEAAKDGSKLDTALRDLTDKGFAELIRGGEGATEILQMLRESMPDDDFRNLFSSVEAGAAALQLTGENFETFSDTMAETMDSAGARQEAFDTISETTAFQFKVAMAEMRVAMVELGLVLLPVITKIVKGFNDMSPTMRKVILVVGGLVAGISVLVTVFGPIIAAVTGLIGLLTGGAGLSAAIAFLATNPIGWLILAIAALVAAGVLLWKNWDTVKEKAGQLADWIVDKLGAVLDWLGDNWQEIAVLIAGPFAPLVALATDAFGIRSALTGAFGALLEMIIGIVSGAVHQVQRLIDKILELFALAGDVPGIAAGVAEDAARAIPGVGGLLNAADATRDFLGENVGIPFFDSGGVVPGPRGSAVPIIAHAGETILPTHKGAMQGGNTIINVNVTGGTIIGNSSEFERTVVRALNDARAKGGF